MLIVKAKAWDDQISKHFSLREFRCQCDLDTCNMTKVDSDLVDILEELRSFFFKDGIPSDDSLRSGIYVTCGYRCQEHNDQLREEALKKDSTKAPSEAKNSYHIKGMAADIRVPNHYHKAIADRYHGRLGIGFYNNRLHIDVRKGCARWGKIPK